MSPEQVRAFQAGPNGIGRYDWEGKPLEVDGELGPRTRWSLAISGLDPRRQAIVTRACHFVGLVEQGANRGREIDAWLERCDAPLGSAWCAAFASWCVSVHGLPPVAQAGAQALGKRFPAARHPAPGDVMWFRTGEWQGHCGIVVGSDLFHVAAVEGNSNNAVRLVRRTFDEVFFGSVLEDHDTPPEALVPPGLPLVRVAYEGTR